MNSFSIALIHNLVWSYFNIVSKQISGHIGARDALGLNWYFIPFGIVWASVAYLINSANLTDHPAQYTFFVVLFAFSALAENYLGFMLYQFLDTSSFFKFQLWIGIFLNMVVDYVAFHLTPSFWILSAGVFFVLSGYLLDSSKHTARFSRRGLMFMFIMVSFATINGFAMKQFALHSTNDFVNLFVIQIVTQVIIGAYGCKNLMTISKMPELRYLKHIYAGIIFLGIILEFFMFKSLSLFIIAALANVRFIIYLGFDYWNGQVRFNRRMISGVVIGIIGSLLMAFSIIL